jgi:hypothetical protein
MTSMTSMTAPALSFGEGSNGLDSLFSTISPFSPTDPIMRGIRDGTLTWAEAAELEEAEAAAGSAPFAPFATPATSAWAAAPPLVRQVAGPPAPMAPPLTPPRAPRATLECPGAPMRPRPQGKVVKTLIVRNLPRGADDLEALLRHTFEPYGAVRDIYIPKNMDVSSPYFGTIKGFALVKFAELASAYSAAAVGLRIGRNNLSVEFAKEDR